MSGVLQDASVRFYDGTPKRRQQLVTRHCWAVLKTWIWIDVVVIWCQPIHLPLSKYGTVGEFTQSSGSCRYQLRWLWLWSCRLTSVRVVETRLRHKPLIYHSHSRPPTRPPACPPSHPLSISPLWSTGDEFCNNGNVPQPRTVDEARKQRYCSVLWTDGTVCACLSVARKLLTYGKNDSYWGRRFGSVKGGLE